MLRTVIALGDTDPVAALLSQDIALLRRFARGAIAHLSAALVATWNSPSPDACSRVDDLYTREGMRLMAVW